MPLTDVRFRMSSACRGMISLPSVAAIALILGCLAASSLPAEEAVKTELLFGFEEPAATDAWTIMKLPELSADQPAPQIEVVPTAGEPGGAAAGKALKITFHGGDWPTIGSSRIAVPGNWQAYQTLEAELTVDRPGVAFIRVLQSGLAAEPKRPPWQKTLILQPGLNSVQLTIRHGLGSAIIDPKLGDVTALIIGMFRPVEGQTLLVDNVRLTTDWPAPHVTGWYSPYNHDGYSTAVAREFKRTGKVPRFRILGSDLEVDDLKELEKLRRDRWSPPEPRSLDQVEGDVRARFAMLKADHPRAVLAMLRDGERGWNPVRPDEPYAGWSMVYISSHGPDGPNHGREETPKLGETTEAFMRHRVMLMRVDLASVPPGSKVLAAWLVVTRDLSGNQKPAEKSNLWVAEPCNRAFDPAAANCYRYAAGRQWQAVNGLYYGEDPDSFPVWAELGPGGGGAVSAWDFTPLVQAWVDGQYPNHGLFFHGVYDYMRMFTNVAKDVKQRPAVLVIYEPK